MQIYYDAADGQIAIADLGATVNNDGDIIIRDGDSGSYFMLDARAALRLAEQIEQAVKDGDLIC